MPSDTKIGTKTEFDKDRDKDPASFFLLWLRAAAGQVGYDDPMSSLPEQTATCQLNATGRASVVGPARRNERLWLVPIIAFRCLSVLCCLLWMPLVHADSMYLLFACVGIIAAQIGLIAIWNAWAASSAWIRVPAAAAAALLLWVYVLVGYAWTQPGNRCSLHYWEHYWRTTLALPLFFATTEAERREVARSPLFKEAQKRLSDLQRQEADEFARRIRQLPALAQQQRLLKLERS
jgi:hypothetical protein